MKPGVDLNSETQPGIFLGQGTFLGIEALQCFMKFWCFFPRIPQDTRKTAL